MRYALCDRRAGSATYGLSCDEEGVFLAGDIRLVTRDLDSAGQAVYKTRPVSEVGWLLTKSYGAEVDFSNQIQGLKRVAAYMTEGRWVLAKITAVQLRFPELPDNAAVQRAITAHEYLTKCRCETAADRKARKRDVSDEPRIPAGQTGGGQWTMEGGSAASQRSSLLIPVQAITAPTAIPAPFELPMPPTGLNPPLALESPASHESR
jgi:hypothetical protein